MYDVRELYEDRNRELRIEEEKKKKKEFFKNVDSMDIKEIDELLEYCLKRKEEAKTKERLKLIENFLNAYNKLSDAGIEIHSTCQDCGEDVWLHKDDFNFI